VPAVVRVLSTNLLPSEAFHGQERAMRISEDQIIAILKHRAGIPVIDSRRNQG
jgi:hypothetical protein